MDGSGLIPAEGFKAKFYAAGTANPKTIYDGDGNAYPSPSNEATLNAEGYAVIQLGDGGYKLIVTDADGAEVFTLDNIQGAGSFSTGFVETVQPTEVAPALGPNGLAAMDPSLSKFAWCGGYWEIGDGGHGFFWNADSSEPDDGGYVIASTKDADKRWFRIPDEDDAVRAASFGYVGTKAAELGNELLAAAAYASGHNKRLRIGPGSDATIGYGFSEMPLYALGGVVFEPGSMLTGDGSFDTLVVTGPVSGSPEQHFTAMDVEFRTPQLLQNPEWFGASTGALDNTAAFGKWLAALPEGGAFLLPPGVWLYADTSSFPYPTVPLLLYGSIDATTGNDIPTGMYFPGDSRFRMYQILFPSGGNITDGGGGGVAVVGNTSITGALSASGNISSNAYALVKNDITAGVGNTVGKLFGKAASFRFATGGQLAHFFGNVSTSGTTETNLHFYAMPGDTLIDEGDSLVVEGAGTCISDASSGDRTLRVLIGGVEIFSGFFGPAGSWTGANATVYWNIRLRIWVTGVDSIAVAANMWNNWYNVSGQGSFPAWSVYTESTPTLSAVQTIQFKGTALVSGSITQSLLSVDFYPTDGN
jgi:hypothetical protein